MQKPQNVRYTAAAAAAAMDEIIPMQYRCSSIVVGDAAAATAVVLITVVDPTCHQMANIRLYSADIFGQRVFAVCSTFIIKHVSVFYAYTIHICIKSCCVYWLLWSEK